MRKEILFGMLLIFCIFLCQISAAIPTAIERFSTSEDNQTQLTTTNCGTMTILKNLEKNPKACSHKFQGFVSQALSKSMSYYIRPTDPGGGIDGKQHLLPKLYNTTKFVIHWTNGTDGGSYIDAVENLTDTNGNSVPDYIENFGEIFEHVWTFEVTLRGFPAPPTDETEPNDANRRNPDGRYDIFVYAMGYLGLTYPEQWPTSHSYSYIVVKHSYLGFRLPQSELMKSTAAHEFFHAIQFYYDCTEENWWLETSAAYMEDEVYPDVNQDYENLPEWFQFSDTHGLESTVDSHEYGNYVFAKRLSEDFGNEIIKEIWQEMSNTNGLRAIDNVLASKNSSLVSAFSKFITSNFFLEDMYVDGAEYREWLIDYTTFKGVWLEYQYNAPTAPTHLEINSSNVNRDCWMDKWATDYITMKLDPIKPSYNISFDGLDLNTNYLVKLVTKKDGVINETIFNLNSQKDDYLELNYDTFSNITLIMANAGNTDSAKPSWRVSIETLSNETTTYYHDVAVTNVSTSANSIAQGNDLIINVTTANQGNSTETFNVMVCLNDTPIQTRNIMLVSNDEQIIVFSCNTTGIIQGKYILTARVEILPNETNTTNNVYQAGIIEILPAIHDIAVSNITFSSQKPSVGKNLFIYVTVENHGGLTETFDVTLYVNTTAIHTENVTLTSINFTTIIFTWNTSGLAIGNYTIRAYATPVENETYADDNTLSVGLSLVMISGDINGDSIVDIYDALLLANAYNSRPTSSNWNTNADINSDNIVDIYDAIILANHFNQHYP